MAVEPEKLSPRPGKRPVEINDMASDRMIGGFSSQAAAIDAIKEAGEQPVVVSISWTTQSPQHVAFRLSAKEAAALMGTILGQRRNLSQETRLRPPNPGLAKAIDEGRTLNGRFDTASELFDALERQGQN